MTNLQTTHADGRVVTHRHLSPVVALAMFDAFNVEVTHPDDAETIAGDHRIVKVIYVG